MGSLWNRSGTVERYADDIRADGAKAFFFQGGTTAALTVYRDAGSSSAFPVPVTADANGRWPDVFVPYIIAYDVQVKSKDDVQITFSLGIPNPDPVDLSVIIPAEERIQTGMMVPEFVNAIKPGYVRLNGRTIGNPSSLATERANTDTANLFNYLWNNLPNTIAPVSSGRGASSTADFAANKNIVLPTMQGMSLIGLDDMGTTPANAFSGLTFNIGSSTQGGSSIGSNSVVLSAAQMPAHSHTGTTSTDGAHTHPVSVSVSASGGTDSQGAHTHGVSASGGTNSTGNHSHTYGSGALGGATGGGATIGSGNSNTTGDAGEHSHTVSVSGGTSTDGSHGHNVGVTGSGSGTASSAGSHTHTMTTSTVGGTTAINMIQSSRLVTWFIKL